MHRTIGKLHTFDSIDLAGLQKNSALLDRKETKYLTDRITLASLIDELAVDYDVLEINGQRTFAYDSCYFDTDTLWCYHQHHQGKRLRAKIRTRSYLHDESMTFFEVKLKKQTQTYKYRYTIPYSEHGTLSETSQKFLSETYERHYHKTLDVSLHKSLSVSYKRITLVHKTESERLTIDFSIVFHDEQQTHSLNNAVIIESKSSSTHGPSKAILHRHGLRTIGPCSKYCLAAIILKGVKNNKFKWLAKKVGIIEKLPHFLP